MDAVVGKIKPRFLASPAASAIVLDLPPPSAARLKSPQKLSLPGSLLRYTWVFYSTSLFGHSTLTLLPQAFLRRISRLLKVMVPGPFSLEAGCLGEFTCAHVLCLPIIRLLLNFRVPCPFWRVFA